MAKKRGRREEERSAKADEGGAEGGEEEAEEGFVKAGKARCGHAAKGAAAATARRRDAAAADDDGDDGGDGGDGQSDAESDESDSDEGGSVESESSDEDASDSDGDIELDAIIPDEQVQIDFEFHDPDPTDFHSTRALLQASDLVDGASVDISELAEMLTDQAAVGTVLKSGGKEEPALAFLSCLVLQRHPRSRSLESVQGALLAQCPSAHRARLQAAMLGAAPCALLVNERLVNMPAELLAPLHTALHDDLDWATRHAATAEVRAFFQIEHCVAIVRCERAAHAGAGGGRGSGGGGRAGGRAQGVAKAADAGARGDKRARLGAAGSASAAGGAQGGDGELVARRADDELLRRAATLAFPLASRLPAPRGRGAPSRLVALLLTADAMRALPAQLDALARAEQ